MQIGLVLQHLMNAATQDDYLQLQIDKAMALTERDEALQELNALRMQLQSKGEEGEDADVIPIRAKKEADNVGEDDEA